MPCGMYGALTEAGCGVMGVTVVGCSGMCTLVGATSLECNLGVTLADGTWMGITLCERRGESEGERTGV
jgi:Asp/Glu/hydantoin racemase